MAKRGARIKPAAASTLNYVGEKTLLAMVRQVSAQTGMPEEKVRRYFVVRPASTNRLRFEIDGTAAMVQGTATRPLPRGARRKQEFAQRESDSFFQQREMVNIVDMGDERVCPICEALAEEGPYTIEEARAKIPAHPNCRCVVEPMERRRTAPIQTRQDQGFRPRGVEMLPTEAMGELLGKMRSELRTAMARP